MSTSGWTSGKAGAKVRYYFRRPGFMRVPLPGLPGSAEFMQAYQEALTGQLPRPQIGANRTKAGSIAALVVGYFCSPQFLALAPATQQTYRLILEKFRNEHGDKPVALLTRQHINAMLAAKVVTPAAANHWLRLVKSLMVFAVEESWRKDNPTTGIKSISNRTDGFHTWTEGEIEVFEAHHPVGSKARLALALLLYTAQRRSDVVRMGRQHISDGMISVRQKKTGTALVIPVHPDLAAIIEATPSDHLTFLTTASASPSPPPALGIGSASSATRHLSPSIVPPTGYARPPVGGWPRLVARPIPSPRSVATPPSPRWRATPKPPTRSAWPVTAWPRSDREQAVATAANVLPNQGKRLDVSGT